MKPHVFSDFCDISEPGTQLDTPEAAFVRLHGMVHCRMASHWVHA